MSCGLGTECANDPTGPHRHRRQTKRREDHQRVIPTGFDGKRVHTSLQVNRIRQANDGSTQNEKHSGSGSEPKQAVDHRHAVAGTIFLDGWLKYSGIGPLPPPFVYTGHGEFLRRRSTGHSANLLSCALPLQQETRGVAGPPCGVRAA